jgi:hypothetical protein
MKQIVKKKNCYWNSEGKCEWKCILWNDGVCEEKDPCLRVHNESDCYEWCIKTGDTCVVNPCYQYSPKECPVTCTVVNGTCDVGNCTLLSEDDECDVDKNCTVNENGLCVPDNCKEGIADDGECPEGCKHNISEDGVIGKYCVHDPCSVNKNLSSCGNNSNCSWVDGQCVSNEECSIKDEYGKCKDGCVKDVFNTSEDVCIPDPCAVQDFELLCSNSEFDSYACKWDSDNEVCRTDNFTCVDPVTGKCVESCIEDKNGQCQPNNCDKLTIIQCEQLDYCTLYEDSCRGNDCVIPVKNEETGIEECDKGCTYDADRGLCTVDDCRQYTNTGNCNEHDTCRLYVRDLESICIYDPEARANSGEDENKSKGSGFPWWIIIVIVAVVTTLLIALCVLVALFLWKRKKDKEKEALEDAEIAEAEDAVQAENYEVPPEDDGIDALKFGDLTLDALIQDDGGSADVAGVAIPTTDQQPAMADLMVNPSQTALVGNSTGKQNYQLGEGGLDNNGDIMDSMSQSSLLSPMKKKKAKNNPENYVALDNNDGGLFEQSSISELATAEKPKKKKKKALKTIEADDNEVVDNGI